MEFVGNIVDFGTAPEIHINDIARVEMISANVVRVTLTARHFRTDGQTSTENWVMVHLDFDKADWERFELTSMAARIGLLGASHEKLFLPLPARH